MKLLTLLVVLLVGCAESGSQLLTPQRLAGSYSNHDGFWPRALELGKDGNFSYHQLTDVIQEKKDGTAVFEGSWGMIGTWTFEVPDRIQLVTQPRKDRVTIYVRRDSAGRVVLLEPDLFPDILTTWSPSSTSTFSAQFLTR